jgi:CubicO group peptidase (beta-lactamase class C family)
MKRNNSFLCFVAILLTILNSNQIYSSTYPRDSTVVIYNGIPEDGIFDRWMLLGPVPILQNNKNPEDEKLQENEFDKVTVKPKVSNGILSTRQIVGDSIYNWQFVQSEQEIINSGIIDLTSSLGNIGFASAYAYAQIRISEETDILLGVGSDDALKIWVNGEVVFRKWTRRGLYINNDLVPVRLKKGNNEILIKIQNRGNSWSFVCHAINQDHYSQQLHFNSQIGNIENINQLLKCGVNINSTTIWGLTPLQTAHLYGQNAMADFLLEQGADSTIKLPNLEKMVDTYFNFITKEDYPGAAVLISKNGQIQIFKSYGYANLENEVLFRTDMKFKIASVTKQYTAAAILKLQEQGFLNVNDRVSKYVPEMPGGSEVTIHHLLTHSSGLPRDINDNFLKTLPVVYDTKTMLEESKNLKSVFNPGESWSYSNFAYSILAIIIERVSGLSYSNFLDKHFFEPLGMLSTGIYKWDELIGWEIVPNEVSGYFTKNGKYYRSLNLGRGIGAGNLYSTLEDLYKWNEALFNHKALNQVSLEAALIPVQTKDGSPDKFGIQYGYGLWIQNINNTRSIHHGGAIDGYECRLLRLPDLNMNIIIFLNRFPFPIGINTDIISQEIVRICLWDDIQIGQ